MDQRIGILILLSFGWSCGSTPIDPLTSTENPPPAGGPRVTPGATSGAGPSGNEGSVGPNPASGGRNVSGGGESNPPNSEPTQTPAPSPSPSPSPPTAAPPVCVCPASPIDTEPLQTHILDGSGSYDPAGSGTLACHWTVLLRPAGSTEPLANADTARASFFVDLAGNYKFQLACLNSAHIECTPCTVDLNSTPRSDDLHIQLVWDTQSVDVDLHLLRAGAPQNFWFTPDDCYYGNRSPNWFAPGYEDDCRVDIDDTDGFGPENVNIKRPHASPPDSPYRLAVHYYSDDGIGPTNATVRIYCYGALASEAGPVALPTTNTWWDVGTIAWPGCQVTISNPPSLTTKPPLNP